MATSRWVGIMALLIMIAVVVPFTLLSQVHAWYGSFLLWSVMGVLVIAINARVTRHFRASDRHGRGDRHE
ncbi:hypothetical protein [Kushneria indalinina]|uniref:Uncharacterized protein n=1 Tax=Kushneria indalinina DSM 14324 TaxID=1122140 RepID=A0A3D9DX19_9GAMM|nr:hypothetical protein [Kushneria indalinina]REC95318.1 hypothetical protein C8D72_2154 [Kushneria indalinina DSM 14324]